MKKVFSFEEFVSRDEHGEATTRTVEVPDGKWIVTAISNYRQVDDYDDEGEFTHLESTDLAIVGDATFKRYITDRDVSRSGRNRWGTYEYLYVSDRPFGIVCSKKEDDRPVGGMYFHCARQVHKGELGRRPLIERPQFAREGRDVDPEACNAERRELGVRPIARRNLRRSKHGWARLTDVARLAGLLPEDVLLWHFPFTHADNPCVDVLFAEKREDIKCRVIKWQSWSKFHPSGFDRLFKEQRPETIWIRQGFALTVLYLHHLGYVPEIGTATQSIAV